MKTKNLVFLLMAMLLSYIPLNAQTAMNKYALDVNLIKNEYSGDYGSNIFNFSDNYFGAGLSLQRWMSPSFNVGAETSFGNYGFFHPKVDVGTKMKGNKLDFNLFGTFKFNNGKILPEDNKFAPFVSLGLGIAGYSELPSLKALNQDPMIITKGIDLIVPVGAGFSYAISKKLSIQYKYLFNFTTADNHDVTRTPTEPVYSSVAGPDAFGKHVISLRIGLGNNTDDDKDGVYDKKDLCLGTPEGVKVDEKGCPLDGDADGVADYLDKCSDTPAGVRVDENGCPVDTDKDGVADYLDKSPNTPAKVKVDAEGRPLDADKDGVADYLDKCSGTPQKVKVDASGCPVDTDKDGIADYLDKCPNDAGVAANNGCPEVKPVEKPVVKAEPKPEVKPEPVVEVKAEPKPVAAIEAKVKEITILDIPFETGKSAIGKSNYAKLDNVATIMMEYKDIKVEVGGHADSQGSASANMKLSESRAEMVKAYLVHQGVDESRISTKGYGITMPVADNATAEGRAQNRRASFKVVK